MISTLSTTMTWDRGLHFSWVVVPPCFRDLRVINLANLISSCDCTETVSSMTKTPGFSFSQSGSLDAEGATWWLVPSSGGHICEFLIYHPILASQQDQLFLQSHPTHHLHWPFSHLLQVILVSYLKQNPSKHPDPISCFPFAS